MRFMEKIGKNEPCPCGSGKKYKQCYWEKELVQKVLEQQNPVSFEALIGSYNNTSIL